MTSSILPILQLMVGASLGPAAAGIFQIAQRFLSLAATITIEPIRFVVLPVLAEVGEDRHRFQRGTLMALRLTNFVILPVFFGLLAVTPVLLPLVIGSEKSAMSVMSVQMLLLVGGFTGTFQIHIQALTAVGKTGAALVWTIGMLLLCTCFRLFKTGPGGKAYFIIGLV